MFFFQEHSVDDELHKKHCSSNDLSLKTTFYNNDLASHNSLSKLNNLSSNVMSVDKTITGFSIQMVFINLFLIIFYNKGQSLQLVG